MPGYSVYNLPTELVSNTLDCGKFEIGTGNIFSAVLTGNILNVIKANVNNEDKYKGIPIEENLPLLERGK